MNIGELTRTDTGNVIGYIAEPGFDFEGVFFEKVVSNHPRAPLFNLMTKSPGGRHVRLGSIWERTAEKTGEVYFRGYIDSTKSGYVPIRLFQSRQQNGVWNVVRRTGQRKRQDDTADLPQQQGPASGPASHDVN